MIQSPHRPDTRTPPRLTAAPDPGFGVLGRTSAEYPHFGGVGSESIAYASTLDAQGRLLIAGHSFDAAGKLVASVTRFLANGTPDVDFGLRGFVTLPTQVATGAAWLRRLVVQADGSLVVGFDVKGPRRRHVLLRRLSACGAHDLDFMHGCDGSVALVPGSSLDTLHGLHALPDGGLLVMATTHRDRCEGPELALLRLRPDGSADPAFGRVPGAPGVAWVPLPPGTRRRRACTMAMGADGDVVIAGELSCSDTSAPGGMAVCRIDASGRPVGGFGREGVSHLASLQTDVLRGLLCRPDGRVLAVLQAGSDLYGEGTGVPKLAQLRRDGVVDPTFGSRGIAVAPFASRNACQRPQAWALQPDGRLLLAATPWAEPSGQRTVLSRWHVDGSRDDEFGRGGTLDCAFSADIDAAGRVSVDSVAGLHVDGRRVIVAGHRLEFEMKYKYCAVAVQA